MTNETQQTPKRVTTAFVRRHYSMGPTAYRPDGSVAKMPSPADVEYCERQFDQWLAYHDAEIRARAMAELNLPFVSIGFDGGTTLAVTGENAGHWVEGTPTHVPITAHTPLGDNPK